MQEQTNNESELAKLLVETLNLEDVDPGEIAPEDPLFNEGLGLDSIDALELALAITQKYSIQLKATRYLLECLPQPASYPQSSYFLPNRPSRWKAGRYNRDL